MVTHSSVLLRLQTEVLEAVARGEPLTAIAELLCHRTEAIAPGAICSILAIDPDGTIHPLAAPSLPAHYSRALDGLRAGPKTGSCGTAAWRKAPVIVTDIEHDALWEDYREMALPLGLRACWSTPIFDQQGNVVATFAFYFATCRGPDAMERKIVETCVHLCALALDHEEVRRRNHRLAYYDGLTGLPNRGHFNELLARRVAAGAGFGLLLIDIDHLKLINDTVGHGMGDVLISTIAGRISGLGPNIVACRLGGDEFAVLVDDCHTAETLGDAAAHILAAARGLIEAGGQTIDPHITIGGALFGPDGQDGAALRQNADFALYHAKEVHRGDFVHFSPGLRTTMLERASMVRSVDRALAENRILAHYQPVVRLDSAEIVGLEALARMRMPDGRIASAGEFHAALADPRIAWQLTGQMLTQIAGDIRRWLDMGIPIQHVGINVTTGDFQRGDLEQRIVAAFGRYDVPLKHIVLEVNEAVFMGGSDQAVPKAVGALRRLGMLVALDDFGTGFASLTHLLSFPVDVIKIDKSFVDNVGAARASDVIVGSIIDIARKLDMRIIAEGIETADQVKALSDLGCVLGQGYLFSRPVSFDETTRLLQLFAQYRNASPAIAPSAPGRKHRSRQSR
ncbi:bifunctional diguanylate cyclase/phosphodiesterase [Devosia aquimaris]|uniref:bifunctional diguanylate cyclase/phosphodiesterase n=1 Tax=Devosia aquimaris TaxID=2866214 RepID=UPI001CD0CF37|nr:EAL domain-containing protein [Devosia sp. CJK-A8-3]